MNETIQYIHLGATILLALTTLGTARKLKQISSELKESRVLTDKKLRTSLELCKAAYNKSKELESLLEQDSTDDDLDGRERDYQGASAH